MRRLHSAHVRCSVWWHEPPRARVSAPCLRAQPVARTRRHALTGRRGEGEGGGVGGSSRQNVHAMVVGVSHDDAPVAVDGDAAKRAVELSVA